MRLAVLLLAGCQAAPVAPRSDKLAIAALGVRLAAPAGSRLEEGGGPDAVTVESSAAADCTILLWREDPAAPARWEDVMTDLSRVKSGSGRVRTMQREERLSDGSFRLEWTQEGPDDRSSLLHGVYHRVHVGAAWIGCARTAPSPAAQACVRAACESLEPL